MERLQSQIRKASLEMNNRQANKNKSNRSTSEPSNGYRQSVSMDETYGSPQYKRNSPSSTTASTKTSSAGSRVTNSGQYESNTNPNNNQKSKKSYDPVEIELQKLKDKMGLR